MQAGQGLTRRTAIYSLLAAGSGINRGARANQQGAEVTAYVALDREFSEPLLDDFQKTSRVSVRTKFDVESTKTIGLVNLIRSEAARPRADIFWNNEVINTIRLKNAGLLEAWKPKHHADFPTAFQDPEHFWHGFAARARVLVVNTTLVPMAERPKSLFDLASPRWRHKVAIAKPFFGTTATHAASLYAALGTAKADRFFADLHRNEAQVHSGNKPVAEAVAAGRVAIGLTDTDDALVMQAQGHPVAIVYPDQQPGQLGTLFLPNTLALVKNAPHAPQAKALLNWLYRPEVETHLSSGPSGQIPLSPKATKSPRVESPATVRPMEIRFEAAAEIFDDVMKRLAGLFQ